MQACLDMQKTTSGTWIIEIGSKNIMDVIVPQVKQVADWGANELWVARIQIGLPDLIRSLRVRDQGEVLEHLLWMYQQIGDELTNAFIALRRIKKGDMLLYEEQKEYSNLYGHLWSAYKDRFQTFMKEFGYDVGFVFKKDEAFLKGLKSHCKKYELPSEFEESVVNDRANWQLKLADIRNDYNEHRKLPHDVDLKYFKPEVADLFFNNVWQAIEDMVASHIKAEYSRTSKIVTIYEIPEEKRDSAVPVRFQLGLTPEGMKGLSQAEK